MGKLEGKTAVVTGGTTGLGYETAKLFVEEGARVIITGQDEQRLAAAAKALGGSVVAVRADVRALGDLDRLAERVREEFGALDVLFVNAGIATFGPLDQFDESAFDALFDVNVKGAYYTTQKLVGLLKAGSSVIFNASAVNEKGLPGVSAYSATKAAVRSLARSLGAELGPRGIRVNALSPGYVPTEIQAKMGLPKEEIDGFEARVKDLTPLGRVGRPDEIAKAAVFLASEDSSYITAVDVQVDGGFMNV